MVVASGYRTTGKNTHPVHFSELSQTIQLSLIKAEFNIIVKRIFNEPGTVSELVRQNTLSKKEALGVLSNIKRLNAFDCSCCHKFDPSKLKLPLPQELEPLISLAKLNAEKKSY